CALAACFLWRTVQRPLLVFDSGFQLSFLSMAAIFWAVPFVHAFWIRKKEESKRFGARIRAALLTSWTVLVVISPVISYAYFETSRYAMLINLLVLPMLSFLLLALLVGLACMILAAMFGMPAYHVFLFPATLTARLILRLSLWFEHLPGNVCITGRPQAAELLLYIVYFGGGLLLFCLASRLESFARRRRMKTGKNAVTNRMWFRTGSLLAVLITGFMIPDALHRRPPAAPELTMLDVGQGDGFIFRFPDGGTFLIDCGNTYRDDLWERVVEPALLYYGIDTVDAWLLTHFDMDHISAYVQREQEIAKAREQDPGYDPRIRCRRLLISQNDSPEELEDLCRKKPDPPVYTLTAGMRFSVGGMQADCLLPDPAFPAVTENDASVVLRMECNGLRLLFCGDMSREQEIFLLERGADLSADILKVAHHGSGHSTCDAFAEAVSPKLALISVGKNSYGHPAPDVLTRLALTGSDIRMTNRKGAVIVVLKDPVQAYSYLP
ncbi:MAG: ComEC/Rec2 family competence protein, partial [Lachnospiraceae bacterium]|nr:ComEC/Rec2 family competence protein [Lachnospiraceae bacterium]